MKKFVGVIISFVLCVITLSAQEKAPRNIIVMIGDGMGIAQVTAGRTYKGTLSLDAFPYGGFVLTHAYGDDYITDSAAGATAYATGEKSYNGAIGMKPDGSSVETLLEAASRVGKKTGVVVTCSVTHATPAAFLSHVPQRAMQIDIAAQIAESSVDVLLGTGWGWFLGPDDGGRRADKRNLIDRMKKRGFVYVSTPEAYQSVDLGKTDKFVGLFAENHPGPATERNPSLSSMVTDALTILSRHKDGFVLTVEGSQIDWRAHENDSDGILIEMADFDDAIGVALRFAETNQQTLIVVTADHETGGYALTGGSIEKKTVNGSFVTKSHTGTMVPIFSFGPMAARFSGILQNDEVGRRLRALVVGVGSEKE